ncbi:MAG: hypothetical protein DRP56_04905 [Planctomycetota bacterium]|nr:MAG: hypothetical protein DRP56_04905 [Planctomycetota bacterium]
MPKITLNLTIKEAKAMLHALGNSMEYSDIMDNLFSDAQKKKAAYRAGNKLQDAIREHHEAEG